MEISLMPEEKDGYTYYKANLHSHSTVSDGHWTPEEMKERYMAHGYSAIAFTDHEAFVPHNDLTDEHFLALNGVELAIRGSLDVPYRRRNEIHMNFIAMTPEMTRTPFYHREKYLKPHVAELRPTLDYDHDAPDFEREYTAECINTMSAGGQKDHYFVAHNHPYNSLQRQDEYEKFEHFDAVEIWNSCDRVTEGMSAEKVYDDFLNQGKRLWPLCCDDNHNTGPDDVPSATSYRSYVWVASKSLNYEEFMKNLKAGNLYASTGDYYHEGPKFKGIYLDPETRTVRVEATECTEIFLKTGIRACEDRFAPYGETITTATFTVREEADFFRIVLRDKNGFESYSKGFFFEDYAKSAE